MRSLLRVHWPLLVVLAIAATVRVAVVVAYRPAIFFGDSWAYLDLAFGGSPVAFAPDRPSGYPLLIDVLSIFGRSLGAITTAQHIAGLVTGVLVYALLVRLRVPRWLATAGAAVVLLDAYAIALEQQILAEAFFTLALAASFFLVAGRDRGALALAASGALLAAATTMRTAALFAVPVWVVYVVWAHRRPRLIGPAALGLILPLLVYASWHAADTGRFGLTQADGWFLYGRVGEIADCGDADVPTAARPLCDRNARDRREGAAYHIWNADGPARRTFGGMSSDPDTQARSNDALRGFARAIIRDRPGAYARLVRDDFLRYFTPGAQARGNSDLAVALPQFGRIVRRNEIARDRWFPGFVPHVSPPAKRVRDYHERVHVPRPLMAALAIAALLQLAVAAAAFALRRPPPPRRREVFLLAGAALAMLFGTAATSEFVLRYLIPVVPLLVCGGVAAAVDLAALAARLVPLARRGRTRGRPEPAVP
jgi:Dolichyl-phosphate-mannose-protein mannosyltransferase